MVRAVHFLSREDLSSFFPSSARMCNVVWLVGCCRFFKARTKEWWWSSWTLSTRRGAGRTSRSRPGWSAWCRTSRSWCRRKWATRPRCGPGWSAVFPTVRTYVRVLSLTRTKVFCLHQISDHVRTIKMTPFFSNQNIEVNCELEQHVEAKCWSKVLKQNLEAKSWRSKAVGQILDPFFSIHYGPVKRYSR